MNQTFRIALAVTAAMLALGVAALGAGRVWVANNDCSGHALHPRSLTIACGDGTIWATRLGFKSYGSTKAVALGRLNYVDCNPNCASGSQAYYRARFTLSRIVTCNARRYYSRISWSYLEPVPSSTPRGVFFIRPLGC
jgi:hypothetical protein